jgi:hypothetical protein
VPTTTSITTTTIPPMPAALAMTWEQVPAQEAFGLNDFIWSVIEAGPGLVAVGGVSDEPGGTSFSDGAVWVSEDGSTWERAGDPEVFSGVPSAFGTVDLNQVLTQVAEGPAGLVATGWVDEDTGDTALPIWLSPDGITWSRHPSDIGDYPDGPPEGALVSVETGYLLFEGVGGPVWASPDGSEWTRTVDAGTVDGPADAAMIDLDGVVPWDSGFIAVDTANVECSGNGFGACFGDLVGGFTTDGAAWETAPIGSSRGWVYGLSAVGDRVLALGYDEDGIAAWMSMDGITWERSEIHGGAARDILLFDALRSGDRLLMAGGEFFGGMPLGAAVVFASDDGGVTWYEVFTASASDEGPFDGTNDQSVPGIRSLVEFDGTILAVGGTGNGSAPVWIGTWDEE